MEPKSSWQPGPAVCRCCLTEGCYKDISSEYFWMGKREVYADMLSETLDVNISYTTSGGRLICESCISRLRDATEFKKQVLDCEKTFIQLLQPNASGIIPFDEPGVSKPVKAEIEMKLEKDDSDDDFPDVSHPFDDDDDDELDLPLKNFATKIPKEEPDTEILELLNRPGITAKRVSTSKVKASPAKKAKVQVKAKDKPSSSKPTVKVVAKTATKKTVTKAAKEEKKKKESEQVKKDEAGKVNAQIVIFNSTARPFKSSGRISIKCCFCVCEFEDPSLFRAHMDAKHTKLDQVHAVGRMGVMTRVDVNELKCKRCAKPAADIESLATHLNEEHGFKIDKTNISLLQMNLVKNAYYCFYCKKRFTGLQILFKHSATHLNKYVCTVCGLKFGSSGGYVEHVRNKHSEDNPTRQCYMCNTSFPTSQAYFLHRKSNKNCYKYSCKLCKLRFPRYEDRRNHDTEVHGKKQLTYPCTKCDLVFYHCARLGSHYRGVHTDEFKCQYCNKTFRHKDSLVEHTNRHTGEKPYKCDNCDAAYFDRKSLRNHKKKHI